MSALDVFLTLLGIWMIGLGLYLVYDGMQKKRRR